MTGRVAKTSELHRDDGPLEEVVVLTFDLADAAREGLTTLRRLHRAGDIRLSAGAVVGRSPNGRPFAVEQPAEHPSTADAHRQGSDVASLLTGPFGLVLENAPNALVGSLVDIADVERCDRLLRCFGVALPAGRVATVALLAETRPGVIAGAAAHLDAVLMRRSREDVEAALHSEGPSRRLADTRRPGAGRWSRVRSVFTCTR